eukprot:2141515-Pyramimonas_sp.AAC.1
MPTFASQQPPQHGEQDAWAAAAAQRFGPPPAAGGANAAAAGSANLSSMLANMERRLGFQIQSTTNNLSQIFQSTQQEFAQTIDARFAA